MDEIHWPDFPQKLHIKAETNIPIDPKNSHEEITRLSLL